MSAGGFSHKTLVGNFVEAVELEEAQIKEHLERKKQGTLQLGKMHSRLASSLQAVPLTMANRSVHVGDQVMLYNHEAKSSLACDVTEDIGNADQPLFAVTCSQDNNAYTRSVFTIETYRKNQIDYDDNEFLHYGEGFHFVTHSQLTGKKYYLWSVPVGTLYQSKITQRQMVALSPKPDWNTVWQVLPLRPMDRAGLEGDPVPVNDKIVINHCATNRHLNSGATIHRTLFGLEHEIVCETSLDLHKAPRAENQWHFVQDTSSPDAIAQPEPL